MKNINLNFGSIKDSIIRILGSRFLNENEDKSVVNFIKDVKKSPVLHKQFLIYKNIKNCKPFSKERLAERFLRQNLELIKGSDWNSLVNENKQIRKKYIEDSHVESDKGEHNVLFNNIHILLESTLKPGQINYNKDQEAYENIITYLNREVINEDDKSKETTDNPKLASADFILKLAANNFDKRYEHLNEEEKKVFKMLTSENEHKTMHIEEMREDILKLINEKLEKEEDKDKIELLKEYRKKLNNKKGINELNKDDVILEFADLKLTLVNE